MDLSRTPAIVYFEARMKSLPVTFIALFLLLLIPTCADDGGSGGGTSSDTDEAVFYTYHLTKYVSHVLSAKIIP